MSTELYYRTIDFLRFRKRAYQLTFTNPTKNEVLKDLAKFCRAERSCFHESQRKTDVALGRQEVWLRIQHHLNLQPDQLYELLNTPSTISQPSIKQGVG